MNTPSSTEINKTANMDPNLLTRHYKLKLMNDFMNIKYQNPKMKQSEIANNLNMSPSTLQRYRNDINMLSPYRINPNNIKKRTKKAKIDNIGDLKRPQMTSAAKPDPPSFSVQHFGKMIFLSAPTWCMITQKTYQ